MSIIKNLSIPAIPFNRIQVLDAYQVREGGASEEHIENLLTSISANGQETPVWVIKVTNSQFKQKHPNVDLKEGEDQYVLIAGFSRMAAIQKGIEAGTFDIDFAVRCEVKYKGFMSEAEQILFSTSENMNREQMTPVQIGRIVRRLIALNVPQKTIAERLGLTQPKVSQYNAFVVEADMATQELVENGQVSFTAATAAVKTGITGEGLKEIVAEAKATNTKVTTEKVLVKANQQSVLSWFRKMIPQVEAGNFTIAGDEKQFSAVDMWKTFSEILDNAVTITALVEMFTVRNGVKEPKAPKGQLVPQNAPNGAMGFEADGEEE